MSYIKQSIPKPSGGTVSNDQLTGRDAAAAQCFLAAHLLEIVNTYPTPTALSLTGVTRDVLRVALKALYARCEAELALPDAESLAADRDHYRQRLRQANDECDRLTNLPPKVVHVPAPAPVSRRKRPVRA